MRVADIMTSDVATVAPSASVAEAARAMLARGVSGLPVVGADGRLLGMITEGDLLRRAEAGTENRRSWWLRLVTQDKDLAADFAKAHATRVEDAMTRAVVAIDAEADVARAADLLDRLGVKRLPVLRDGALVGVISRRDLLKPLAAEAAAPTTARSDAEVAADLRARLRTQGWITPAQIAFSVKDGVVSISGALASHAQRQALHALMRETPGVRDLSDQAVETTGPV